MLGINPEVGFFGWFFLYKSGLLILCLSLFTLSKEQLLFLASTLLSEVFAFGKQKQGGGGFKRWRKNKLCFLFVFFDFSAKYFWDHPFLKHNYAICLCTWKIGRSTSYPVYHALADKARTTKPNSIKGCATMLDFLSLSLFEVLLCKFSIKLILPNQKEKSFLILFFINCVLLSFAFILSAGHLRERPKSRLF